jgi:hypothetical protein
VVIKRALSLSERATQIVTPSTAVGVALAHAGVLEIGGMLEQCENVYIKAVMEHTGSLPCLSAYTRFLKQYGSVQLAETLEQEVGTRKSGASHLFILLPGASASQEQCPCCSSFSSCVLGASEGAAGTARQARASVFSSNLDER